MFLDNWYKVLEATFVGVNVTVKNVNGRDYIISGASVSGPARTIAGGLFYTNNDYCSPCITSLRTSYATQYGGVIIGTGNTAPTKEDYKLSGDIITTFSYTVSTVNAQDDLGSECTVTFKITNNGSEEFTIREIGLISAGAKSSTADKVLWERTVLDEPVTIPAGDLGEVKYTIRFNRPTA